MARISRILIAACFAGALVLPGQALAVTLAPPGHAGASQYSETIPTSRGNAAPPSSGSNVSGRSGNSAIAQLGHGGAGVSSLSHLGKTGQAAAALAAATAPARVNGPKTASATSAGQSPTSAVLHALSGVDGGMGIALPILLATALLAGFTLIAAQRPRRGEPPEAA
jgi:hypothetical protein